MCAWKTPCRMYSMRLRKRAYSMRWHALIAQWTVCRTTTSNKHITAASNLLAASSLWAAYQGQPALVLYRAACRGAYLVPGGATAGGGFLADIMRAEPLDAGRAISTAEAGVALLRTAAGLSTGTCLGTGAVCGACCGISGCCCCTCGACCCCCLPETSRDRRLLWGRSRVAASYCCSSCCVGTACPCAAAPAATSLKECLHGRTCSRSAGETDTCCGA